MVALWGPPGAQSSPKSYLGHILVSFWEASGTTFGVILAQNLEIGGIMLSCLCPFSGLGERSQNGAPQGGGGHAIRSRRRMFREGRPSSRRLHFGLHFGVVLGAKFATILPWGRPGGQNRLTKEGLKKYHERNLRT